MDVYELAEHAKELSPNDRYKLLKEILSDEKVSVTELLLAHISDLEEFKLKARRDIPHIAEAGMELGEREMRRVTGIKGNTRKKTDSFYLSMVKCLLEAGAYKGTEYEKQIQAADFSSVDSDWYEYAWKPQTSNN